MVVYICFIKEYEFLPIFVSFCVFMLLIIGEKGVFPFNGHNIISHKKSFYVHLLILSCMTADLNSMKAPTWYPTENTQWIFIVWILYGILTQFRGIKSE